MATWEVSEENGVIIFPPLKNTSKYNEDCTLICTRTNALFSVSYDTITVARLLKRPRISTGAPW